MGKALEEKCGFRYRKILLYYYYWHRVGWDDIFPGNGCSVHLRENVVMGLFALAWSPMTWWKVLCAIM